MKRLILFCLALISCLSVFAQDEPVNWEPPVNSEPKEREEWSRRMSPSIGYGAFLPRDRNGSAVFHGVNTELSFYSTTRYGYDGPGFFRIYTRFSMMKDAENSARGLFTYAMGTNLSFEKGVKRKFLVPYYGIELGGMNRSDLGGAFQITPLLGLNILSFPNFAWNLQGGYTYATSRNFNQMSGVFAASGITISFW